MHVIFITYKALQRPTLMIVIFRYPSYSHPSYSHPNPLRYSYRCQTERFYNNVTKHSIYHKSIYHLTTSCFTSLAAIVTARRCTSVHVCVYVCTCMGVHVWVYMYLYVCEICCYEDLGLHLEFRMFIDKIVINYA